MSTKCTVAHGENFHFYREVGDNNNVYLELENVAFEVSKGAGIAASVMVAIPVEIFETIKRYESMHYEYADKTDEEIFAIVENEVTSRLQNIEKLKAQGLNTALAEIMGIETYGLAEDSYEAQVARGRENLIRERENELKIRNKIQSITRSNRPIQLT